MVAALSVVCRQLLIIAGLSLFLDVLLPGGAFRRYTQFVMGLLMVSVLLNPLLGLYGQDLPQVTADVFSSISPPDDTAAIIAAGAGMNAAAAAEAGEELAQDLARQIRSLILLTDGVEDGNVQVELSDTALLGVAVDDEHNWGRVIIVLTVAADKAADAGALCGRVRRSVAELYGISEGMVQVSVAGYGAAPP